MKGYNVTLPVLLLSMILTCGCSHKPQQAFVVVPPECITKIEVTGNCQIDGQGRIVNCPSKITYACTKVVQ